MVRKIKSREKEYVDVTATIDAEGVITPLDVTFYEEDEEGIKTGKGTKRKIDEILDRRQAASTKVGGNGIRFIIRFGSYETRLFYENPRWFVEKKIYEADRNPCA